MSLNLREGRRILKQRGKAGIGIGEGLRRTLARRMLLEEELLDLLRMLETLHSLQHFFLFDERTLRTDAT